MIYKFLHDLASTYLFNPISYCSPPRSLHCRHTDLLVIWKNISLFPAQRFYIFCSLYLKYSSSSLHSNLFLIIQASVQISPQRGLPHSTLSPFLHSPSLLSSLYIPLTFFICLHITYQYLKLSFSNLLEVHCLSPSLECKLQEDRDFSCPPDLLKVTCPSGNGTLSLESQFCALSTLLPLSVCL